MPSYVQVLTGRANVLTTWWLEIVAGRPPKPSAPWHSRNQIVQIWLIYGSCMFYDQCKLNFAFKYASDK